MNSLETPGIMRSCLVVDPDPHTLEITQGHLALSWPDTIFLEAATLPEACERAQTLPSICIANFSMVASDLLRSIRLISTVAPKLRLRVLTEELDDALLLALVKQGVAGIVEERKFKLPIL
jgi:DNA-binding NarL/FixJ family response regulator